MIKQTLLEIVQDVLVALDSDSVADISETEESLSIAAIAKSRYYFMMAHGDWPHLRYLGQLTGLADVTKPNYMRIPDLVSQIDVIKYDVKESGETRNQYKEIPFYEDARDFLDAIEGRDNDIAEVTVVTNDEGVKLHIYNERSPSCCTSFDDEHIVFDAYDSGIDTTMVAAKSQIVGIKGPSWTVSNTFTPDLPGKDFPAYLAAVVSQCFEDLKQQLSQTAAKDASTGQSRMRRKSIRTTQAKRKPNYGRK